MTEPISHWRRNGYDVYVKNGEAEYWAVLEAYLRNDLPLTDLAKHKNEKRRTYRAEFGGRSYVLKWARMGTPGFKRFCPRRIGLTYFTHVMRKVGQAVAEGCDATQDVYLVAEKWTGWFSQEVLVLLEYIEGHPLALEENIGSRREELRRAMASLRKYGLTLSDFSPWNFIVTGNGIRVIDLACRVPAPFSLIKDAVKLKAHYGIDIPFEGTVNRFLHRAYSAAAEWGQLHRKPGADADTEKKKA